MKKQLNAFKVSVLIMSANKLPKSQIKVEMAVFIITLMQITKLFKSKAKINIQSSCLNEMEEFLCVFHRDNLIPRMSKNFISKDKSMIIRRLRELLKIRKTL